MKLRATWLSEVNKGAFISTLLYIVGILEMLGGFFIVDAYLNSAWQVISFLGGIDPDSIIALLIRIAISLIGGTVAGGFTIGFAVLIEDVHAIRVQTAGYDVEGLPEPEPEPEPEVVEQPARHGKRKAQREQPEDYDPYDDFDQ